MTLGCFCVKFSAADFISQHRHSFHVNVDFSPNKKHCLLVAWHGNYSAFNILLRSRVNGAYFQNVSITGPKKETGSHERSTRTAAA